MTFRYGGQGQHGIVRNLTMKPTKQQDEAERGRHHWSLPFNEEKEKLQQPT
jgi:hypothetical protein